MSRVTHSEPGLPMHLVVQFLLEASDLATEVTPKASSTCEMKLKECNENPQQRELCFLSNTQSWKMKSPVRYPDLTKPEEDVFWLEEQAFEAQFLFSLFSLIPGKNCRATSCRATSRVLKSSLSMIT